MSISEPLVGDPDLAAKELRFRGGLPGFAGLERFVLTPWGAEPSPFSVMQSVEDEDLSFVVVPPMLFFPDYAPEISNDAAFELGISSEDDAMVLVIVTVRQPVQDSTANLLGPLIVNVHDLTAIQAVLDPERFSPAAPLASDS